MTNHTRHISVMLAALGLASCAPATMPPQQVQASNPTVTYKYRGDQELIHANQNASAFCSQYQSVPRTVNLTNDSDGNRVVVFECVPPAPAQVAVASPPVFVGAPAPSPLVYSYATDQQLLNATRNAQAYCLSVGTPQMTSVVVNNPNGTRTVTFHCGPA